VETFLLEQFAAAELIEGFDQNGIRESAAISGNLIKLVESDAKKAPAGTLGLIEFNAGRANVVNRNRRFYSLTVYELAAERAQALVTGGQFLGEVDHPYLGTLKGAAFRISKLWMDGEIMKAEAVILDTDGGRHLKGLLSGGVGVAISTRGYGSAKIEKMTVGGKELEVQVIQNDFRLEGIDAVLFPSNPAGAVTRHEHVSHNEEIPEMDLETLRTEHPELVAQIESAAREGLVAQEAVDAAAEEARAQVVEGDEVQNLRGLLASVVEALRPHVPELQVEAETAELTEAERQVVDLTARLEALEAQVQAERSRADDAVQAQAVAEAQAARIALVDGLLEGYEHAELVRDELLALEGEDAIRSTCEARKSFIESVLARRSVQEGNAGTEDGAGQGQAESKGDVETTDEAKRAVAEARELAGLA
jgi:hypothetical protein